MKEKPPKSRRYQKSNPAEQPASPSQNQVLAEGKWGDVPWQFVVSPEALNPQLCTAAFCVVTHQEKILLVRHIHNHRGWELPGGHIEPLESPLESVFREVLEEGRVVIKQAVLFGHKRISPPQPIPYRDTPNAYYPFPHSYVLYYYAEASEIFNDLALAADVAEAHFVSLAEAMSLCQPGQHHDTIIHHLLSTGQISLQ